jgi:uncharacterized protein YciI
VTSEIPDGLAIERIWVVEAAYGPDAAERRPAVRAQHLARIAELRDSGTIIEAGAFTDMSASLILVRAPSEEAALAVMEADIYFRTQVWIGFRVRAFGRAVRADEIQPD